MKGAGGKRRDGSPGISDGLVVALVGMLFLAAFAVGLCGPLWDAMPWAVTP